MDRMDSLETSEFKAIKRLNLLELAQDTIVTAVTRSTTYCFRVIDAREHLVEVLEGNTHYFPKRTICRFVGATKSLHALEIQSGYIVEGLGLEFAEFEGDPERAVVTSPVSRFSMLGPPFKAC